MNLIQIIREYFAAIDWSKRNFNSARAIRILPSQYPAWVVKDREYYGVAIPYSKNEPISEHFESCRFYSDQMNIPSYSNHSFLFLMTDHKELRQEFAAVCAQFVDPGEKDENRIMLEKEPLKWWEKWRELLGNSISILKPHSVIGELVILNEILKNYPDPKWTGPQAGSVDIETKNENFEVKSTLHKSKASITINSQHQLYTEDKPLYLCFVRLEKSSLGISINDMVKELIKNGYNETLLERQLEKLGYEKGSSVRNKKYKCLEKRKYLVNDTFPKITNESFIEGHIPKGITHIEYSVDLEGLDYELF